MAAIAAAMVLDLVMAGLHRVELGRPHRPRDHGSNGPGKRFNGNSPRRLPDRGRQWESAPMKRFAAVLLSLAAALVAGQAQALDRVRFGTNWVAEAEHGGFYQALADGTYKKYGLDVTIVPGGPNVNNRILLPVGKLDFFMSANSLQTFDAVAHNIPTVAVAASFQK